MRQSQFFAPMLKADPAQAEVISHRLMLRAGLIRSVAAGIYTWLPMGLRVIRKIEAIAREELDASGAQEVLMPVVQPAELWEESGRWKKMGAELQRLQDRHERDFCLGPTHEEVITDLFRREIQSYKQLPCNFYQIQTKFRDEVRPRFGVMRAREFTMKDGYSFHDSQASFDATYREMHACYTRILKRLNLEFRAVEADAGDIGGSNSHEFHVLASSGEDVIVHATNGDYAANLERAVAELPGAPPPPDEAMAEVATPGRNTIAAVAEFLHLPATRCLKTLIVRGTDGPVALVLRGDHELNLVKAAKLPDVANPLEFATPEEVRAATGTNPGSIGPVGLELAFHVDPEARAVADFVCGANRDGWHYRGVNWERDVPVDAARVADIRNVLPGDKATNGQGELRLLRGIEVGHIFQLGTIYSEAMQAYFLDQTGKRKAPIMGCYGMGITRMVAAIIEQNHDDRGICWPAPAAPFDVHLLALNYDKSAAVRETADRLLALCAEGGIDALLDDRAERPGVKFAEADLLGLPHRITIGERGLKKGQVEYKARRSDETVLVAPTEVAEMPWFVAKRGAVE